MGIRSCIKKIAKSLNAKEKIAVPYPVDKDQILKDKVVLVTGGTGGIGFAIAKAILAAGGKVVITGTTKEKVEKYKSKLNNDFAKGIILNLQDISSFDNKIEEALNQFDEHKIDVLINSAGVNPMKTFFDIKERDFDLTVSINVKGTYFLSQKIAKYMIEKKIKGHILNLSSASALRPAQSPYEISKWAIKGMTVGLADQLLPYGIIVNAIAPGPTATPMLGKDEKGDLDYPSIANGRFATPEEIANLAIILISDYGNLVVGDTLYATGGSGLTTLHH